MAESLERVETQSVGTGKLAAFWLLIVSNTVLLSIYWLSAPYGDITAIVLKVLFGVVFVPGIFVVLSQIAKGPRNNVARIDIFTMVSAFVFCFSALSIYIRFFV